MEEINIDEIGLVSNDVHQISLVDWSDVSSIVKFKSEFKDYLLHLDDYSHVIVV